MQWAKKQFLKSLSMNTVGCAIYKCGKACYAKKSYVNMVEKPPLLWVIAYLKWTEANCKTVLWSNKLNFVFWKHGFGIQTKEERVHSERRCTIQLVISIRYEVSISDGMVEH